MQKGGRGAGSGNWTPVNSAPISGTSFTVPNLAENSEWEFRVTAVNDAGLGKPSKSTGPHKVRDPVCKYCDEFFYNFLNKIGVHNFFNCLLLHFNNNSYTKTYKLNSML